ncbi:hypothetical protein KI387_009082, partial [Taxus chinensis]
MARLSYRGGRRAAGVSLAGFRVAAAAGQAAGVCRAREERTVGAGRNQRRPGVAG